jgi:hypothetical protein
MRLYKVIGLSVVVSALSGAAMSDEAITVQSLLAKQFVAVGAVSPATQAGVGLFLQKGDQLFLCFVTETRTSTTVLTNYCKPVR